MLLSTDCDGCRGTLGIPGCPTHGTNRSIPNASSVPVAFTVQETDTTEAERSRLTWDVSEVAIVLGISKTYAYGLVRDGTIPSFRLGGRWLIPRAALEAWVNDPARLWTGEASGSDGDADG